VATLEATSLHYVRCIKPNTAKLPRTVQRKMVSGAFPSWKRSILTEMYLCHASSYHEIEDGHARTGLRAAALGRAARRDPARPYHLRVVMITIRTPWIG
jgi:hypothetical protein